jgi:hypothetical protein
VTRPLLSYDYAAELEVDVAIGLRVAAEMRGGKTDLQIASEAVDDAARRLMRQAAREPVCASAYDRAKRRYVRACNAYAAALSNRRIAA